MAPSTPSAADDSHVQLLEQLDINAARKPFRSATWKAPVRRNKNIKQVLAEASRREASLAATQNNSGSSTPAAGGGTAAAAQARQANIAQAAQSLSTLVLERNAQAAAAGGGGTESTGGAGAMMAATYSNIESAPSLHPAHQRRYCDITGLPAPYTDPKSRLRYHNQEVFRVVRGLGQGVAETYLEARGAHVILK